MQITLAATNAAETRLVAAFLNDLADLQELQRDIQPTAPTQAEAKEAITPPKKTRTKKNDTGNESAATAEQAAESGSSETAQPAADEGKGAPAATEPVASSEEPAGTTEASPDSPSVSAAEERACSLDELRVLFGELSQAGKRAGAVAIVRKYGANGLAEIPEDKRGAVYAEMKGL